MLSYATTGEAEAALGRALTWAEAALGRALTWAEAAWLRYSASMPDSYLHLHGAAITLVVYTLAPLPLALLDLRAPEAASPYKLQPRAKHSPAAFLRCYVYSVRVSLLLLLLPYMLVSYADTKIMEMRRGLPLPSTGEVSAQLAVYFLMEDYINYWIHRLLHTRWCYDKIHSVHHEFTAPMGYAVWYDHWAEKLLLSAASLAGPAVAPCHVTTLWLWFAARLIEGINIHSGFRLPFGLAKLIPFYGGAEHHDYHHYVGGRSQSNFAPVFTYCDYIYGTDKGYKYHEATKKAKLREVADKKAKKGEGNTGKHD